MSKRKANPTIWLVVLKLFEHFVKPFKRSGSFRGASNADIPLAPALRSLSAQVRLTSSMVPVLMLFLLPVGGGIPAGVLLARAKGLAWPMTAGLYFVSDVILALAFEPVLRLLAAWAGKVPLLARFRAAMKVAMARSVALFSSPGAGPFALVMIAFGVDPMTGRATALAAGHGFLAGWTFAIAGDMLYYAVIAVTTLRLNAYFRSPNTTILVVLGAMIIVPILVRSFRSRPMPSP